MSNQIHQFNFKQLESILMLFPLIVYAVLRLAINIILQPMCFLIIYINFLSSKIENGLIQWHQAWVCDTNKILNSTPKKEKPLVYGPHVLRKLISIMVKTIQIFFTTMIFMPLHIFANCTSLVSSKINLPQVETMNNLIMYFLHGKTHSPITGRKPKFYNKFFFYLQSLDTTLSKKTLRFKTDYTALGHTKKLKLSNINLFFFQLSGFLTIVCTFLVDRVQACYYCLQLPITFILNIFLVTIPFNFLQLGLPTGKDEDNACMHDNTILVAIFSFYLMIPLMLFGRNIFLGTAFYDTYKDSDVSKNYYGIIYQTFFILKFIIRQTIASAIELLFAPIRYLLFTINHWIEALKGNDDDYRNIYSAEHLDSLALNQAKPIKHTMHIETEANIENTAKLYSST